MNQSVKRLLSMVLVLLFLVAAFVFFFELVQPAYGEVQTLRGNLLGEQQSLTAESALVTQAQNLLNAYNSQSQGESSVALAIPTGEDVSGALTQIEGLAQNDSVNVTSIAVGAPTLTGQNANASGQANGASSSSPAVKPLGSFTLNIAGSGSYEALQSFLSDLETNIRIFDLQTLSIQPLPSVVAVGKNGTASSGGTRDAFSYQMTVQTYYQLP